MLIKKGFLSKGRIYEIIRRPLITEKTSMINEQNQYAFVVDINTNKVEVKTAIETLFKVKVEKVNILVSKGKSKIFRSIKGKRKDTKKAYIRLKKGQVLDINSNI